MLLMWPECSYKKCDPLLYKYEEQIVKYISEHHDKLVFEESEKQYTEEKENIKISHKRENRRKGERTAHARTSANKC